jgi:hypothetical protein
VVISPNFKDVLLGAIVSAYRTTNFSLLPIPTVHGNEITGDAAVSAIHWDGGYEMGNHVEFDDGLPKVIRLLTAGGRSVIGQWNGEGWTWMQ